MSHAPSAHKSICELYETKDILTLMVTIPVAMSCAILFVFLITRGAGG